MVQGVKRTQSVNPLPTLSIGGGQGGGCFKKKTAFTLAEVLITLVVIGVVAAMTVPVLTTKYQKQQTAIKLKKVYSEFNQAVALAEARYGSKTSWDWNNVSALDFFEKYLNPFVRINKDKMSDVKKENIVYYDVSGKPTTQIVSLGNTSFVTTLASGTQVFAADNTSTSTPNSDWNKNTRKHYLVDLNGYNKPNRFGRDLFALFVTPEGIFFHMLNDGEPYTAKKTRNELLNGPSVHNYQCNSKGLGIWCGAVIMMDGWEIKDDYPW